MQVRPNSLPQSGQVGIAIMLMMVVMSTVGFALATRASRDIQTSRQAQDAVQTFSAAESIVENVLAQTETELAAGPSGSDIVVGDSIGSYNVTVQQQQEIIIPEGTIMEIPLAEPGQTVPGGLAGRQISIEWAESTDCANNPASLIITAVSNTVPAQTTSQAVAGCNRTAQDNIPYNGVAGSTLARQTTITLTANDTAIRIASLYNSTPILIQAVGAWTLPSQQFSIRAVARNQQTEANRETKAIQVERTREYAPSVLHYSLVSGSTLTK